MRERPILFSAPMVRAILEGRKTQTRRVMKVQPVRRGSFWEVYGAGWSEGGRSVPALPGHSLAANCPYGHQGDQLWVRETFCLESNYNIDDEQNYPPPHQDGRPIKRDEDQESAAWWTQPHYRATDPAPELDVGENPPDCKWKPSIFMPRWASRITLEVTGVRVERLRSISHTDAIAEGIHRIEIGPGYEPRYSATSQSWADAVEQSPDMQETAIAAYRELWESINGLGSWIANPWVWVVEFRRL